MRAFSVILLWVVNVCLLNYSVQKKMASMTFTIWNSYVAYGKMLFHAEIEG